MVLVLAVVVLSIVGLVMVLSASTVRSIDDTGSPWWFFRRQAIGTAVGVVGFVVASRVDYRAWRRHIPILLGSAAVLLLAVLVPGVGIKVDGARRWLGFGAFRIQPSELAKLGLLVFAADLLARRELEMGDWRRTVRPIVLVLGITGVLMMGEPDLASLMVIVVMVFAMLVAGGVRARHLATLTGVGIGFVTLVSLAVPWRRARMFSFVDPLQQAGSAGYQVTQSLIALHTGGWTGVGLGEGRGEVALPPRRAHRLHLRGDRGGARAPGRAPGDRPVRGHRGRRRAHRGAGARSLRGAARRGRDGLDHRSGGAEPRRGRRRAPGDRRARCPSCPSGARRWSGRWWARACS